MKDFLYGIIAGFFGVIAIATVKTFGGVAYVVIGLGVICGARKKVFPILGLIIGSALTALFVAIL